MKNQHDLNNIYGGFRIGRKYVFILAALIVAIFLLTLILLHPNRKTYSGPCQISIPVTYSENGVSFQVEAIPGEVIVIFNNIYSRREEKKIIKKCGGKIIAQTSKAHYYVVSVTEGNENAFIQMVREQSGDVFVFPNAVSELCMARPVILDDYHSVIENFSATHGEMVNYSFKNGENNLSVDVFDVSDPENDKIPFGLVEKKLIPIIKKATKKKSPVINMSFGPGFSYGYVGLWNNAPDSVKAAYRNNYIGWMKGLIKVVKPYDDNDFIIVKSLGNEGVKSFGKEILQPLLNSLKPEEQEILNKHFVLVAAKDDNDRTYSNEITNDMYHPLVTSTDISDMEFNHLKMHGTSFSSPRTAGYISTIMNKYDIGAIEALTYAKQATQSNAHHLLVYSELDSIANNALTLAKDQIDGYVDLGLPSGILWKSSYEDGLYEYNDARDSFGKDLPTKQDIQELLSKCRWTVLKNGYKVTGPNGKNIIFPFGLGSYDCEGTYYNKESTGNIWTSSSSDNLSAWTLDYNSTDVYQLLEEIKCCKYPVRLVLKRFNSDHFISKSDYEKIARKWLEALVTKDLKTVKKLSEEDLYSNVVENYFESVVNESDKKKAVKAARELPCDVYYINDNSTIVQFTNRPQCIKGIIRVCIRNECGEWLVYDVKFSNGSIIELSSKVSQ